MTTLTIATAEFIFYGILGVISIIGMLMYMHNQKRYKMFIVTLIFGVIGSVIGIPIYFSATKVIGVAKYILGFTMGATVAFSPVLLIDLTIIGIQKIIHEYKVRKHINDLLYK